MPGATSVYITVDARVIKNQTVVFGVGKPRGKPVFIPVRGGTLLPCQTRCHKNIFRCDWRQNIIYNIWFQLEFVEVFLSETNINAENEPADIVGNKYNSTTSLHISWNNVLSVFCYAQTLRVLNHSSNVGKICGT